MRFKDKIAVVTGAAGAVGYATTRCFLQEGATVVMVDISKLGLSRSKQLQTEGYSCTFIQADTSDEEQVISLFRKVVEQYGRVDIVFSGTGANADERADILSSNAWNTLIESNLTATFFTNKHAIIQMLKQEGGAIVNAGSIYGSVGMNDLTGYSAAKGGIQSMTKSLAVTYASNNIRINCVSPGAIETPTVTALTGKTTDELISEHPIGRLGKPEEVAKCILFLSSDEASFISGAVLAVDGGYTTK